MPRYQSRGPCIWLRLTPREHNHFSFGSQTFSQETGLSGPELYYPMARRTDSGFPRRAATLTTLKLSSGFCCSTAKKIRPDLRSLATLVSGVLMLPRLLPLLVIALSTWQGLECNGLQVRSLTRRAILPWATVMGMVHQGCSYYDRS